MQKIGLVNRCLNIVMDNAKVDWLPFQLWEPKLAKNLIQSIWSCFLTSNHNHNHNLIFLPNWQNHCFLLNTFFNSLFGLIHSTSTGWGSSAGRQNFIMISFLVILSLVWNASASSCGSKPYTPHGKLLRCLLLPFFSGVHATPLSASSVGSSVGP